MVSSSTEPQLQGKKRLLSGWGRTQKVCSNVFEIQSSPNSDGVTPILSDINTRLVIPRGLGRSYGDAAQVAGGTVIIQKDDIANSDLDEKFNLTVSGGTSLDAIMKKYIPLGYFVPVSPGTRYVTVGGAIAADIHGKNHHLDGSFADHVHSMKLIAPTGTYELTPSTHPEIFWATAGGMGLTGIITEATIDMIPIETSYIKMETRRTQDLDELLTVMLDSDSDFRYSVAWIDCLAKGSSMGRSVLTRGDHATLDMLSGKERANPRKYNPSTRLVAPPWFPPNILNPLSVRAFNEIWFRKAPKLRENQIVPLSSFFHPLDGVRGWNRVYGHNGFLQYQFVVPDGQEESLRTILEKISKAGVASFLAVLKRFGPESKGILSFPKPGWTLALDIPIGSPTLSALLDELDTDVLQANGRLYLAKESRASSETIRAMYPRLDEFAQIKASLDPEFRIVSDLSRRLRLT